MVQAIVQPKDRLTPEDIREIPITERGKYIESYLSTLVHANKERGLTPSEIEAFTSFPKGTLSKYLGLLHSKGELYRVKRGKMVIYYPNGRVYHPLHERDMVFDNKKYHISVVENLDGKYIYLQEKDIDESGFEDVVRGIMLPYEHIDKILAKLGEVKRLNLKLED